jgi:hypothetical protein
MIRRKLFILIMMMLTVDISADVELPSMIDSTVTDFLTRFPLNAPKTAITDRYGTPTVVANASSKRMEKLVYYDTADTRTYTFIVRDKLIWDVIIDSSVWWEERGTARAAQGTTTPPKTITEPFRKQTGLITLHPITLQLIMVFVIVVLIITYSIYKSVREQ